MITSELLFFGGFLLLVAFMLFLDLGVFHKTDHVIGFKESAIWTGVWIGISLLFCLFIFLKAEWIHGITDEHARDAYFPGLDKHNTFTIISRDSKNVVMETVDASGIRFRYTLRKLY